METMLQVGIASKDRNALKHRTKLDNALELTKLYITLDEACVDIVVSGKVTEDLAGCSHGIKIVRPNMYQENIRIHSYVWCF